MPLRDHFHQPLRDRRHWEGFHSLWAGVIVQHLSKRLPTRYYAEPHVHLGAQVEVDVATFAEEASACVETEIGNGAATAVALWAPPQPTQTSAVDFPGQDLFEVRVYDDQRGSRLVAAVELVSPANKDRPTNRRSFAVKCAAHLQRGVSVVVVDVVTERTANLHVELVRLLGLETALDWQSPSGLYGLAYRTVRADGRDRIEAWPEALVVGQPLPPLPLWLADDLCLPLRLEETYRATCASLRIRL